MGSAPSSLLHHGVPRPPALLWDHQAGHLWVSLAWELQYQCLGNPGWWDFPNTCIEPSSSSGHGWGWGWMGMGPTDSILLLADELELVVQDGERRVRARQSLPEGFSWGPFQGSIHSEPASPGHGEAVRSTYRSGKSPAATMSEVEERDFLGRHLPCAELWDCMGSPCCFWVPWNSSTAERLVVPLAVQVGCWQVCVSHRDGSGCRRIWGTKGTSGTSRGTERGWEPLGRMGFCWFWAPLLEFHVAELGPAEAAGGSCLLCQCG